MEGSGIRFLHKIYRACWRDKHEHALLCSAEGWMGFEQECKKLRTSPITGREEAADQVGAGIKVEEDI